MKYSTATAVCAFALSAFSKPIEKRQNGTMVNSFDQLESSPELKWTPCFDLFTCALLEVPLDYADPDVGTTDIAFIKWTTNSTNTTAHDILINPGGPGGSGVSTVLFGLDSLQMALGTDNNLVGFDPRGVNNSGPSLSCFSENPQVGTKFYQQMQEPLNVNSSDSIAETFARAGAFGEWCTRAHAGENSTARYVNTVAVAEDMLHYTELVAEARGDNPEEAELWYYGASYGTVLGSVFASLYPNRIGRMILDAVVDVEDYYQGAWSNNLVDADEAVETFFDYCYEGGNSSCPFWADSPEAIKERFDAVVEDLKENPIVVLDSIFVEGPSLVTISDFYLALTSVPYNPISMFPALAMVLVELEQRNGTTLSSLNAVPGDDDQCEASPTPEQDIMEPRHFIACNDANGRYNLSTIANFTEHTEGQVELSKYLGQQWSTLSSVNCRKLEIFAPESQVFDGNASANQTSNPILFIGNWLDPVTPLRHAKKMSEKFAGSGVLTLNAVGHASLAAPSACTAKHVQQYMLDTTLPPEDTVCEPEVVPFQEAPEDILGSAQQSSNTLKKRHLIGKGW